MRNTKVSVIVPIYNASSNDRLLNLLRCLKKQTLQSIEFILVFDCPTDDSYEVAIQEVGYDQRFVFIENDINKHIGFSRNRGIDVSKGEFVAFADDDDLISPVMYENLYSIAQEKSADIVVSPAIFRNQGKESIEYFDKDVEDFQKYFVNRFSGCISDKEMVEDPYPYLWGNGNMWNKIFRRSLIVNNNIRFVDTRYCCYEDGLFQLELFCHTNKIAYDVTPYYTHILYNDKTNTSFSDIFNNDYHRCRSISYLIELFYKYPKLISKQRIEKRVLDFLISFSPLRVSKYGERLRCFNPSHLYHVVSWCPSFLDGYIFKSKIYYQIYILVLKLYLLRHIREW